jgi:CheY-like chemotaxis protein
MSKVLVVDDDPDVAETLGSVLEDEGYEVAIAVNGKRGLEQITKSRPDAVLLDVEMPVLDGPSMAAVLVARDRGDETIPIVLLSGAPELPAIAGRIGTPYYLAKPYSIASVAAVIARAVGEHHDPELRP